MAINTSYIAGWARTLLMLLLAYTAGILTVVFGLATSVPLGSEAPNACNFVSPSVNPYAEIIYNHFRQHIVLRREALLLSRITEYIGVPIEFTSDAQFGAIVSALATIGMAWKSGMARGKRLAASPTSKLSGAQRRQLRLA